MLLPQLMLRWAAFIWAAARLPNLLLIFSAAASFYSSDELKWPHSREDRRVHRRLCRIRCLVADVLRCYLKAQQWFLNWLCAFVSCSSLHHEPLSLLCSICPQKNMLPAFWMPLAAVLSRWAQTNKAKTDTVMQTCETWIHAHHPLRWHYNWV